MLDRVEAAYKVYESIVLYNFAAKLSTICTWYDLHRKGIQPDEKCLAESVKAATYLAGPYKTFIPPKDPDASIAVLVALKEKVLALEDALLKGDWDKSREAWLVVSEFHTEVRPIRDAYRKMLKMYRPSSLEKKTE